MLREMRFPIVAIAVAMMPHQAEAQRAGATPDIVVEGHATPSAKQIEHLTRSISTSTDGQFARMRYGICPQVIGMADTYGRMLADRIRHDAGVVGAPVAPQKCRPNTLVIFTEDGKRLAGEMEKDSPSLFASETKTQMADLLKEDGPVRSWSSTSLRDEDGRDAMASAQDGRGASYTSMNGASLMAVSNVHIMDLSTTQNLDWSVMIFDESATIGKTIGQLADYAAMRLLAQAVPPSSGEGADTILALFSDPHPVAGLTPFDQGFLKGLYAGGSNKEFLFERAGIARRIVHDLRAPSDGSRAAATGEPAK